MASQDTATPAQDELVRRILYRDSCVLILDKPAGITVHAGPTGGPSLEDGFDALRFGNARRPGLAHRLDRDTSGCLVLGRHTKALRRLGTLFAEGRVTKTYWAVVEGDPGEDAGTVDAPLAKRTARSGWSMVVDPAGQQAVTDWTRLATAGGLSLLELRPRTGRTHQIRVHCAALGVPILGDPAYGRGGPGQPLMHLLARAVSVPYHADRPPASATAPVPPHMRAALAGLAPDAI